MTEFEYDCLREERAQRMSCEIRGHRRPVMLPSDYLTPGELARRSGPCRTYRLGRPMNFTEFAELPMDLKRRYLQQLRQRGGSESDVERMLDVPRGSLRPYRVRFDRPNPECWNNFLQSCGKEG